MIDYNKLIETAEYHIKRGDAMQMDPGVIREMALQLQANGKEQNAMKQDIDELVRIGNSLGGEIIDLQKSHDRLLYSLEVVLRVLVDADEEVLIESAEDIIEFREAVFQGKLRQRKQNEQHS